MVHFKSLAPGLSLEKGLGGYIIAKASAGEVLNVRAADFLGEEVKGLKFFPILVNVYC